MKKISEYIGEEALDLLADLIEPAAEIFGDKDIAKASRKGGGRTAAIKLAVKNHKKAIIEILARLDGVPVEEYKCNVLSLPQKILEILNDKELLDFFIASGQQSTETSGTSATETTEESGS
ncbi:MAG: hypothetical protein NC253_05310 [Ruminococcus sp.]|nr:hypothetical protein [Ruminococcus sp.]MCM1380335.1 hypothetical protein [Muribaculaceae bacterium]MCM1478247.1 hypothetical protein [Muribaculaceae bacterium]